MNLITEGRSPAVTAAMLSLLLFLAGAPRSADAGEPVLADPDCAEVLERWQRDPDSVPKALVDKCREQLAAVPAAAAPAAPEVPPEVLDPCAAPGAEDSVYCWGPWARLAPAAGPAEQAVAVSFPVEIECRFEVAEQCAALLQEASPPPPLPEGSCPPGTPCGFATVVEGVTSSDEADATRFARIVVAADGSAFVIDPDGAEEIASVEGMGTVVTPRLEDDYENLRATGRVGDEQSRLVARIVRDEDGNLLLAADVWTHGNRESGVSRSGYFAWGTATSQAGLDALAAGSATLNFAGPMSVDNATVAALTVDFGGNPAWTGTWTNPEWSFGAGGSVTGADLISEAGQFTPNVTGEGNFVQGALLGEAGSRGLAHIIDVNLEGQGRIKDVGLLKEAVAPAAPAALRP